MKRPFCKLCATHHYSHEAHRFEGVEVVREMSRDAAVLEEEADPLTAAERSKVYREKHGDVVRERNRDRMRRVRVVASMKAEKDE